MRIDDKPREECAVFGVSTRTGGAAALTMNGLLTLQHRGQEGAGIAVAQDGGILCHKDAGLVGEVFTPAAMEALSHAKTAVGHTRYSTTGASTRENAGPFVSEYLTGRRAAAHNGNVTNAAALRDELRSAGLHFSASSDSEVVSQLIARCALQTGDLLTGVKEAAARLEGAFSLVILDGGGRLVALRDPSGYRPLCVGESEAGIAVASESCALEIGGFSSIRDVRPGEILVMENGRLIARDAVPVPRPAAGGLCIFEYVYFARPDSVIDGLSVYEARCRMGRILAREHPADADIVCGVPDSGLEAAAGYSAESGLPLATGFMKNRYVGRSFIFPTQTQRDTAVRLKLNPLSAVVRGKRVVLVDDSIVRGTTSLKIVKLLREAGAREVHMRLSAPPFLYPCYFGTDIDSSENLIAYKHSVEEIAQIIGVDSLGFLPVEDLPKLPEGGCGGLCDACFTGKYPVEPPKAGAKSKFENKFSESTGD